MEAIANLVIAAFDLAEAEGRAAHRGVIRLAVRVLAIVISALLAITGVLLVAWACFGAIALAIGGPWGRVWAALICGVALLGVATAAYVYGRISPKAADPSSRVVKPPFDYESADPAGTKREPRNGPIPSVNAA